MSFKGYKERMNIWPEKDQATFYDANKEFTMKKLVQGNLPWNKMTSKPTCKTVDIETPE